MSFVHPTIHPPDLQTKFGRHPTRLLQLGFVAQPLRLELARYTSLLHLSSLFRPFLALALVQPDWWAVLECFEDSAANPKLIVAANTYIHGQTRARAHACTYGR